MFSSPRLCQSSLPPVPCSNLQSERGVPIPQDSQCCQVLTHRKTLQPWKASQMLVSVPGAVTWCPLQQQYSLCPLVLPLYLWTLNCQSLGSNYSSDHVPMTLVSLEPKQVFILYSCLHLHTNLKIPFFPFAHCSPGRPIRKSLVDDRLGL